MTKFFDLFRDHRTPEERAAAEMRKSNKLSKKEGSSSPRPVARKDDRDGSKDASIPISAKRRQDSKDMLGMMEDLSISPKSRNGPTFVGGFQYVVAAVALSCDD